MAVLSVSRKPGAREGEIGPDFQPVFRRVWVVVTDDVDDDETVVREAVNVAIGDAFSGTLLTFCRKITVRETADDGYQWELEAEYGPWEEREETPLDEPPEVEIDHDERERILDRDRDNVAVVNSAGDPFDPPVMVDDSRPVVTITQNEAAFGSAVNPDFKDRVNSATFLGFPAGAVRSKPPRAVRQWHAAVGFYWKVTYRFLISHDTYGWETRILDQGFRFKSGSTSKLITTDDGQPVTEAYPLDGSGAKLAVNADPVFLSFSGYQAVDFGQYFPGL